MIYKVITKLPSKVTAGEAVRLVRKNNRAQARAFVTEDSIFVEAPTQEELVVLINSGVRVEGDPLVVDGRQLPIPGVGE